MEQLDALNWDRDGTGGNYCSDFDYALLISGLPYPEADKRARLDRIMERKIDYWRENRDEILASELHQLACYLICFAVYQRLVPDGFTGPVLRDILHEKELFAL